MELLKNFLTGLGVLVLATIVIAVSILLFPLILVAGSLLLLSIKAILFVFFCVSVIILIGYLIRKAVSGE